MRLAQGFFIYLVQGFMNLWHTICSAMAFGHVRHLRGGAGEAPGAQRTIQSGRLGMFGVRDIFSLLSLHRSDSGFSLEEQPGKLH